MLLHKFWLETKPRFFIGVVFISAVCLFFVLAQPWILQRWAIDEINDPAIYNPPWLLIAREDYTYFIWHFLYNYLLQLTWVIFTIMLALGGLSHESERGSALFTLSLPVARRALFYQRALVGFCEAIFLSFLPVFLIPLSSSLMGLDYSIATVLRHSLLFIAGGIVFYALGIFINTVIKTETAAFFIAIGLVIVFYFLFQPYSEGMKKPLLLKLIDVPRLMSGDAKGSLFSGTQALGTAICFSVSSLLVYFSYYITRKRDY